MRIITLTTDFGSKDWFAGTMKGVILGINSRAIVVDITHEVLSGDIRSGAFALAASYRFFSKGSIHVAVVDPGVGSDRKAIAVKTPDYCFVGPDNGVLSLALRNEKILAIHALENEDYFLQPVSQTFHGRDIFAPGAAHLSRGVPIRRLGRALNEFVRLDWPKPRRHGNRIEGEVVYIDRFGNAITNINSAHVQILGKKELQVSLGNKRSCPVAPFYQSVPSGITVGVPGSTGFLEIAVNGGSAARRFGLRVGKTVSIEPQQAGSLQPIP